MVRKSTNKYIEEDFQEFQRVFIEEYQSNQVSILEMLWRLNMSYSMSVCNNNQYSQRYLDKCREWVKLYSIHEYNFN